MGRRKSTVCAPREEEYYGGFPYRNRFRTSALSPGAATSGSSRFGSVGVREGVVLPTIHVVDKDGKRIALDFNGNRRSVLYILSPTCIWCKRNKANIVMLASAESSQIRFIGLSTAPDRLGEYVKGSALPFPVYALSSPAEVRKFGLLDVTPQTVLVATGGKVQKVWTGAFQGAEQKEIESFFDVKLPGLQESAAASD
jgi:hypothetical protein